MNRKFRGQKGTKPDLHAAALEYRELAASQNPELNADKAAGSAAKVV